MSIYFLQEFFKYFFRVVHEASSSWLKLFRVFRLHPVFNKRPSKHSIKNLKKYQIKLEKDLARSVNFTDQTKRILVITNVLLTVSFSDKRSISNFFKTLFLVTHGKRSPLKMASFEVPRTDVFYLFFTPITATSL
jgi:hypothetical protein